MQNYMLDKHALVQNIEYHTRVEGINELVTKSKGPKHDHCDKGKNNEKRLIRKISILRKSANIVVSLTSLIRSAVRRSMTLRIMLNELRIMHVNWI